MITAGHSNADPGAVYGGTKEADFCADMRNYVAYYLTHWGEKDVVTDGSGRINAPLAQAIKLAKSADVAIEFHLNASDNRAAYGVEVLCLPKHKVLAQKIAYAVNSVTGTKMRGDNGYKEQGSGQHSRLGFCMAGGLIVELEFLSNTARFNSLNENRWLVAKAIAEVIRDYV